VQRRDGSLWVAEARDANCDEEVTQDDAQFFVDAVDIESDGGNESAGNDDEAVFVIDIVVVGGGDDERRAAKKAYRKSMKHGQQHHSSDADTTSDDVTTRPRATKSAAHRASYVVMDVAARAQTHKESHHSRGWMVPAIGVPLCLLSVCFCAAWRRRRVLAARRAGESIKVVYGARAPSTPYPYALNQPLTV